MRDKLRDRELPGAESLIERAQGIERLLDRPCALGGIQGRVDQNAIVGLLIDLRGGEEPAGKRNALAQQFVTQARKPAMLSEKSAFTRQRYAPRLIFTSEPIRHPSLRRKLKMRSSRSSGVRSLSEGTRAQMGILL